MNTGSYPDDTPTIVDNDPTIVDNDPTIDDNDPTIVDNDLTEIYNPVLSDTNIRMPISRSTNNGDKLWIDIRIPQRKYNYHIFM